nr:hypothetical transcript [Hymenolepis microstoma]
MNVDLNTLYGSESSYNRCIQSTESTETNLTLYRLDDSSSANSVVSYFHCPICSYRSVDRFQVQNHYYAIHEENTNCATRQAPIRKSNSSIGGNIPNNGEVLHEGNVAKKSRKTARTDRNVETETTSTWQSEKSNRPSTKSVNSISLTVSSSKHSDPAGKVLKNWNIHEASNQSRKNYLVGRRMNESTQKNSNASLSNNPPCIFEKSGRSLDRGSLHTINEGNKHSSAVCTSNKKRNPYIGGNISMKEAISGGSMENIAQRSMERTRSSQNVETEIISTVKSEKPNRQSRESDNANSMTVISSKLGDPTRKHDLENWNSLIQSSPLGKIHVVGGGGINESAPSILKNSLFKNPSCTFGVPDRLLGKSQLQTVKEVNAHSPTVCTTDIDTGDIGNKKVSLKENMRMQQMDDTANKPPNLSLPVLRNRSGSFSKSARPPELAKLLQS